jgi:CheY-like chemotaxis protein
MGATFIVELPKVSEEPRVGHARKDQAQRATDQPSSLSGCRVLVVEDEVDASELLSAILTKAGAVVETVSSADQALAVLDRMTPDVLLSDIGLSGEDGYTLIRKVRTRDARRKMHLPAAAVTAYARAQDRRRALDAGFDRYVAKPIEPSVIIEIVRSLWKSEKGG